MKYKKPKTKISLIFKKAKKGFTLVELMIYMVLLSVFLITLTDIMVSILDVQLKSQSTTSVDSDSRFILSRLAYDISRSSAIISPANIGDSSSSLTLSIGGVNYIYSSVSNKLNLNVNSTQAELNSVDTQISGLQFQKLGNTGGHETVKINFTLMSKIVKNNQPESRSFEVVFGTR